MTVIEEALFRNGSAHWIATFAIAGDIITITLHPWNSPNLLTRATFSQVKVLSVDDSYADVQDGPLPWDIIGFDCEALAENRWRYCLHTDGIEYAFESGWPKIENEG
jgi:hypothetical protein